MAEPKDESQSQSTSSMQDSWVDVQQGEGKLVHNRSKEELEKLLASAASEEEMSDSDTIYKVTFKSAEQEEEGEVSPTEVSPTEKEPSKSSTQTQTQTVIERRRPTPEVPAVSERPTDSQTSCQSLLWCVPVLILTHLAIFGIGYYLGKRVVMEPSPKLLHI